MAEMAYISGISGPELSAGKKSQNWGKNEVFRTFLEKSIKKANNIISFLQKKIIIQCFSVKKIIFRIGSLIPEI